MFLTVADVSQHLMQIVCIARSQLFLKLEQKEIILALDKIQSGW